MDKLNADFKKKLGFGLMRLPLKNAKNQDIVDLEEFKKLVDIYISEGFTYFDTAYMYHGGKSEGYFKKAVVERYLRNQFTVTDKLPIFMIKDAKNIPNVFQEQLDRCGVDYFDYYWLHSLSAEHYKTAVDMKAFDFVKKMKEEGKVKHLGFSFHDTADVLDKILTEQPEMEYVQLQLNYLDWEDELIQSRKCYEVARKHKKSIIVMEPIKGGNLANIPQEAENIFKKINPELSVASWAVRYVASLEGVVMVLSGMSNELQIRDNISYMNNFEPLNDEELAAVKKVSKIIKDNYAILCTSCHYCSDDCPKKIAIPEYFYLYNDYKRAGEKADLDVFKKKYSNIALNQGKASDCVSCSNCEKVCPQHLHVVSLLKQVASAFE